MSEEHGAIAFTESSGNVFRDLGFPDADLLLAKAEMIRQVVDAIELRRMAPADAVELLGTDQQTLSQLFRGDLAAFSIADLIRFLDALGGDRKSLRQNDMGLER